MQKAHFLKIYVKTEDHKLNFPPIPFFMTSTIISIAKFIYSISNKKESSEVDVNAILNDCKEIIKELKNYPPFEIVTVESNNTEVIIKTK